MKKVKITMLLTMPTELYDEDFKEIVESQEARQEAIDDMLNDGIKTVDLTVELL